MPEPNSRVNVLSKLTVVSSRPIGPDKTHPLSAMDLSMGLHTLHIVLYYRSNPFLDLDLAKILVSLSELLCSYPVITGRLTRTEDENWLVKCNDAGVRMLKAKVGTTIDEWLRSADGSEERDLTAWEEMPDDPSIWSTFCIQINDFEGGGLAVGLSCTHMLADPTSATVFLKSWAELHRGASISHPPVFNAPLNGRSSPNTSTTSVKHYVAKSNAPTPPVKMLTATFRFSNLMIDQCLSQVRAKCPDATPFDVLAALFWTRITRLKAPLHNHPQTLAICVDSRTLMDAPFPYDYFGNASHFSQLALDSEVLGDGGLGHVAGIVHDHVAGLEEKEYWSLVDWFESRKGEMGKYAPPFRMYGPELTCVSLEHMLFPKGITCQSLMYEAMFKKDEKPVHVSYRVGNVEGDGLIVVMPSPEEGLGRTVMVTLPEEQIAKLREDKAILDLKPIMLMSGGR